MCKGPGAEVRFYKASVAAVRGRKGLLERRTGMEMAEAGRWLGRHLGRRWWAWTSQVAQWEAGTAVAPA